MYQNATSAKSYAIHTTFLLYAKSNNKPGIGLLVDFEKAFDSVSFEFILITLNIFLVLAPFLLAGQRSYLETLLVATSMLSLYLWPYFQPVSNTERLQTRRPNFFLCIEVLILLIKSSKVQAYTLNDGTQVPYEVYVDDLTIYLKYMRYDPDFNTKMSMRS